VPLPEARHEPTADLAAKDPPTVRQVVLPLPRSHADGATPMGREDQHSEHDAAHQNP
jgi:hypothetical protein